jgi:acetyltransferase-like isoleucine patch superfamily enzyme
MNSFLSELKMIFQTFVLYYPNTRLGLKLRAWYWKKVLVTIGKNPKIEKLALLGAKTFVEIGDDFHFGESATIAAGDSLPIYIGDQVAIARNTFIRTANHRFDDLNTPIMFQGHDFKIIEFKNKKYSIVIEDDVWVGANSVVLSGAHISQGSIIAAGTVVSGFIPPYSIVMGNPGRVIKNRKLT